MRKALLFIVLISTMAFSYNQNNVNFCKLDYGEKSKFRSGSWFAGGLGSHVASRVAECKIMGFDTNFQKMEATMKQSAKIAIRYGQVFKDKNTITKRIAFYANVKGSWIIVVIANLQVKIVSIHPIKRKPDSIRWEPMGVDGEVIRKALRTKKW